MDQLCVLNGSLTTVSTRAPRGCRGGESSPNIPGRIQPELGGREDTERHFPGRLELGFCSLPHSNSRGVQGVLQGCGLLPSSFLPQLILTLLVFFLFTNPQLPVFKKNHLRFSVNCSCFPKQFTPFLQQKVSDCQYWEKVTRSVWPEQRSLTFSYIQAFCFHLAS